MAPSIAVTVPARMYTEPPAPPPDPQDPHLQLIGALPTLPSLEITPVDATLSEPLTTMASAPPPAPPDRAGPP